MSHRTCLSVLCSGLLASSFSFGCKADSETKSESISSEIPPAAASKAGKTSRKKRANRDKGQATMKLGEVAWAAERTKVRLRDGKLKISASRTETREGVVSRQSLDLTLKNFSGPGEYTTDHSGSRYIAVGIDTKAAKAAGEDAKAAEKEVMSALSGSTHMMLIGAKVTVTAASDTEVSGIFSWKSAAPASTDPIITEGAFRAVYKAKK